MRSQPVRYGGTNARKMIGLPDHEVKANPKDHPLFDIFIQSESVNRHVKAGTFIVVMK